MSDNNSGGDIGAFLAGFVIGGLVGAAAALILAPQSGEETRHQIADRGRELRQVSTERLHEVRAKTAAAAPAPAVIDADGTHGQPVSRSEAGS